MSIESTIEQLRFLRDETYFGKKFVAALDLAIEAIERDRVSPSIAEIARLEAVNAELTSACRSLLTWTMILESQTNPNDEQTMVPLLADERKAETALAKAAPATQDLCREGRDDTR